METITFNNKHYNNFKQLNRDLSRKLSEEDHEKFHNKTIFNSEICPRCVVTNKKLKYHTYKTYGFRCGSIVNTLLRKLKDPKQVFEIIKNGYFYVEELNGFFSKWKEVAASLVRRNTFDEQGEKIYKKYFYDNTKCALEGCNKKVPLEMTILNTCCRLHYTRNTNLKKGVYKQEDLKFVCKIDKEKFPSLSRLTKHIKKLNVSPEAYYLKYINSRAKGTCKWCEKPVPFHNVEVGYRNFCHNTSCNVLWHNKFEKRSENGDKISEGQKKSQNMKNQKGYWIKQGFTEEEAMQKIRERQSTNSIENIMKRKNCSEEEAIEIRKQITEKWMKSNKSSNYSKVSQELFWAVYEKIKDKFDPSDVFFATFDGNTNNYSSKTLEYKVQTATTYRRLDFFIKSINKCIEFDGAYWHDQKNRRGCKNDEERDNQIKEAIGCEILHIPEMEYYKDKNNIVDKCVEFLLNSSVLIKEKSSN